jgi:hypothetical protein
MLGQSHVHKLMWFLKILRSFSRTSASCRENSPKIRKVITAIFCKHKFLYSPI